MNSQPVMSQDPLTGTKGEKLLDTTSPVISGITDQDEQRRDRPDGKDGLHACGAQNAVVLDVPHRQDDERADDEHRVDAEGPAPP